MGFPGGCIHHRADCRTNDPKKAEKFWMTGEGMRTNIQMKNNIGTSNKS